ncbi:MAG: SoxR reducing system RseC family protein [Candidatus Accumulibacter sp.]|jgi:sigma-E factor negative regulatory protein RseC|nr:SoxR reducing system RseC family protein [Accumulibacter sp.]
MTFGILSFLSMIDSIATVTALDGDYAVIHADDAGCAHCRGGCGAHRPAGRGKPRIFRVLNPGKVSAGDSVIVSIPDGSLWRSALLAYGIPLLFLFLGVFSGMWLGGEPAAILMAFSGLLLSWPCLKLLSREDKEKALPVIVNHSCPEPSISGNTRTQEEQAPSRPLPGVD